jgi:hypothetical protein
MSQFLSPIISALSGLAGMFLGGWLSDRREREKQRRDFIRLQLSDFYGPMLSMFAEIHARDALRRKLISTINQRNQQRMQNVLQQEHDAQHQTPMESLQHLSQWEKDEKQIFTDMIVPAYRQILGVFRDKICLSESTTRQYLPLLIEFTDINKRLLRASLPPDVATEMGHDDKKLDCLYQDITATHDRLRQALVS